MKKFINEFKCTIAIFFYSLCCSLAVGIFIYYGLIYNQKSPQKQLQILVSQTTTQAPGELPSSVLEIKYIGNQSRESFTTVLSTLFYFKKSKHNPRKYKEWSNKMLKSLGAPLIMYVDSYWADYVITKCIENNITGL